MVTHMKTTIEISDALGREARALARARNITFRELVERGLQLALREEETPPVELDPVVFGGEGLSPEYAGRGWVAIAEAVYEGRGT